MRCPFCGHHDTQVKDSRPSEDNATIRRRRACIQCGERFTTFERVQLRELHVLKKDGSRELFDRDKMARSLTTALRKRPFTQEQIEQLVNDLVRRLESGGEGDATTDQIGALVMGALRKLDTVAYIRFASVYMNFQEADDFETIVAGLDPTRLTPQEG